MSLREMNNTRTFLQIRAAKSIQIEAIAEIANVSIEEVYYLEAGCSYPRIFVDKVLQALSQLAGEDYTLENIGGIYTND